MTLELWVKELMSMETAETNSINQLVEKYGRSWQGKRVAILEDDPDQKILLKLMLKRLSGNNIKISTYDSAPMFIEHVNEGEKEFDLAIVDGDPRGHVTDPAVHSGLMI